MHILLCRNGNESTTSAPAALTALATCRTGFVRRPLVGGAFLVGGATALAGDLALLLSTH
jgi:hypothetical protein